MTDAITPEKLRELAIHAESLDVAGYTSGPWSVEDGSAMWPGSLAINCDPQTALAYTTRGFREGEGLANARLIAASPVLIATCIQASAALRAAADEIERLKDALGGTRCDLRLAVETAYRRGASEWTRLNYPDVFADLQASSMGYDLTEADHEVLRAAMPGWTVSSRPGPGFTEIEVENLEAQAAGAHRFAKVERIPVGLLPEPAILAEYLLARLPKCALEASFTWFLPESAAPSTPAQISAESKL
jgi:hypothetical protein